MIVCRYNTTKECDGIMKNCIKCSMVGELEKIKEEAKELIADCDSDYEFEEIYGIKLVVGVIDNHIKELKGENNEQNINNNL